MEKFSSMPLAQDTLFETHYKEMGRSFKALLESNASPDVQAIVESFDTAPYALDEKIVKSKSDISYVFKDETGDRYRIQFLAAPKFGKGVAKVYIGKGKGGRLFVDKIDRFANPKAMIATVINFFTEHLLTPEGMGLRGFIVDLSGAASIRSIPILKKVIKSALISKIKVADDTFQPQEGRKYLWITKSTLKPADVFNGPGSEGAPWLQGKEKVEDQSTDKKGDVAGEKGAKFDPMSSVQSLIAQVLPALKRKFKDITLTPSLNNQMKWVSVAANVDGQPVTNFMFEYKRIKANGPDMELKYVVDEITEYVERRMKQIADAQKKAKEESERAMNLKKDPAFYLKQQQAAIEGEINLKVKGFNFKLEFTSSGKIIKARILENGTTPIDYVEFTAPNAKEDNEEMRDFAVSQIMKILRRLGYMKGRKAGLTLNQPVKVTNFSKYSRGFTIEGNADYGVLTSAEETYGNVLMNKNSVNHKVDWVDIEPQNSAADGGQTKSQTQTASGKVKTQKDENMNLLIDAGLKNVKKVEDRMYSALTKVQAEYKFNVEGGKLYGVHGPKRGYDSNSDGTWRGENVLKRLADGAFWIGRANDDFTGLASALEKGLSAAPVPSGFKLLKIDCKVYTDRIYLRRHLQTVNGLELREDYEFGRPFGGHFYLEVEVGSKKAETKFFKNYTSMPSELLEIMLKESKGLLPTVKAPSQVQPKTEQKQKGVPVFWKDGFEQYGRIIGIEGSNVKLSRWDSNAGETVEWTSNLSYGYYFNDGKYDGDKVTMSKLVELLNS